MKSISLWWIFISTEVQGGFKWGWSEERFTMVEFDGDHGVPDILMSEPRCGGGHFTILYIVMLS